MPFLSHIRINPARVAGRRLISNPHNVHVAVNSGIPGTTDERNLWRWDNSDRHCPRLLVLTQSKPDWTHIIEEAGWPHADGDHAVVRDYTSLLNHLGVGREYAFRLVANPSKRSIKVNTPTRNQQRILDDPNQLRPRQGFRLALLTEDKQLSWLQRRALDHGFDIPHTRVTGLSADLKATVDEYPDARIVGHQELKFTKPNNKLPVMITTVTFEGRLRVTDTEKLRHALLAGIGPAKGYGCGLLTLAPLSQTHT